MTERIYYRDAYATEFRARIVARSANGLRVTLDRTAFYPTSGGQQFDTGRLNDVSVIDVVDEGENVVHVLSEALETDDVAGRIDWERRFDHMQQHTGQHVLSAVFEDLFGFRTASVHFGAHSSSIDLETPDVFRSQLLEVESRANALVNGNRPVTISFEDAATSVGLRKPPPREGELRVVTVDGVDRSACGGTHVRGTAEIGAILLRRQDKMHGNVRIEFICGNRALQQARADFETLGRAAVALGVPSDEIADRVTVLMADLRDAERARKKLADELAGFRAAEAYQRVQPDDRGVRWIVERLAGGSLDDLRAVGHAITGMHGAAFIGVIQDPPQVMFAASEDTGIDAGKRLKAALSDAGGRGGGSARVAQGGVSADKLEGVVAALKAR